MESNRLSVVELRNQDTEFLGAVLGDRRGERMSVGTLLIRLAQAVREAVAATCAVARDQLEAIRSVVFILLPEDDPLPVREGHSAIGAHLGVADALSGQHHRERAEILS